jgi:hypothetical protein
VAVQADFFIIPQESAPHGQNSDPEP